MWILVLISGAIAGVATADPGAALGDECTAARALDL